MKIKLLGYESMNSNNGLNKHGKKSSKAFRIFKLRDKRWGTFDYGYYMINYALVIKSNPTEISL